MDIEGIIAISAVVGMLLLLGADLGLNVRVIEFLWDRTAGEPRLKEKTSLSSPEATDADEAPEEEGAGGGRGEDFGPTFDTMLNPTFRIDDDPPIQRRLVWRDQEAAHRTMNLPRNQQPAVQQSAR